MKIINVETKEQLKELYDCSAMTWEGLSVDEGNLKDGKPDGQGVGYYDNGNKLYEGEWLQHLQAKRKQRIPK